MNATSAAANTSNDNPLPKPIRFDIVDRQTGRVVGAAKTRARASQSVDRRDNEYGAYRYRAVAVWS